MLLRKAAILVLLYIPLLSIILFCSGCLHKPGKAIAGPVVIEQPQNPKGPSQQEIEILKVLPATVSSCSVGLSNSVASTNAIIYYQRIKQEVSGSFFDEGLNKLKAMRPIQWTGVIILLFGIFTWTNFGFSLIGKSTTARLLLMVSGFALVFLPQLIAGNEQQLIYIGGAIVLIPFIWVIAHRHGEHKKQAELLKQNASGHTA